MGPGIVIKVLLQSSFSLMVFGWTQIVMDIQPLIVMITGEGQLHGFSHTYIGATLIGAFSALTGKYLGEIGLYVLDLNRDWSIKIAWWVSLVSAFIGSYSHVALDSIMHADMEPLWPFSKSNALMGIISISALHRICVYSAVAGGIAYYSIAWLLKHNANKQGNVVDGR